MGSGFELLLGKIGLEFNMNKYSNVIERMTKHIYKNKRLRNWVEESEKHLLVGQEQGRSLYSYSAGWCRLSSSEIFLLSDRLSLFQREGVLR